jgi:serine protease AprX
MGAGVVDVQAALARLDDKAPLPGAPADLPSSTGTGSLEASRGGENVVDPMTGDELVGEYDAQGAPWRPAAWVSASTAGKAWAKGTWNERVWASDKWKDKQILGAEWSGDSWNGVPWNRHRWSDSEWTARSWRNNGWRARSWRDKSWSARSWRGLP